MKIISSLLLAILLFLHSSAQQVTVDQNFNPVDKGHGKFNSEKGNSDDIEQSIIQPDGKILISGYFSFINDTVRNCIARLNPDGTLDQSFKIYGFESNFGNGIPMMRLQPNGKILICTTYPEFNYRKNIHIIRLNADGTKDKTFTQALGQYIPYYVYDIAIEPDGKLILAGDGNQYGYGRSLVRLNINGTYDRTFQPDSVHIYTALSLAITGTGKIIAGGFFNLSDDFSDYRSMVMLNTDGSYDNKFSAAIPVGYDITKIVLQSDSKILYATNYAEAPTPSYFGRLNSDGSPDPSFKMGNGPDRMVKAITVSANGKILIGGDFSNYNNEYAKGFARLNTDGTLDKTFDSGAGISFNNYNVGYPDIQTICINKAGSYFIGGHFNVYNHTGAGGMLLLNTDGAINPAFNTAGPTGAEDAVFAIATQQNTKILIAGDFIRYNGINRDKIARLNADGTLDNSFPVVLVQGNSKDSNAYIHKLLVQQDGKILIGGNFSNINGQPHPLLARLNSDGNLDNSFNARVSKLYDYNYSEISAIAQQPDGKILVGVSRNELNANWENEPILYRLNADGSLDPDFMIYDAFASYNNITSIAVQPDGKILVAGALPVSSGNMDYNNIVRLNKNGSIDNTFSKNRTNVVGTDKEITDIHVMPDGKIMIAGHFHSYNGASVSPLIRLKSNGLLDNTFKAPASLFRSADFELTPIAADSTNVYIGFCSFAGNTLETLHTTIYKLMENGMPDSSYLSSTGANSMVYAAVLDANKQLLIGGSFTAFNGVGKNHIVRLITASSRKQMITASSPVLSQLQNTASVMVAPNPTSDNVWLQISSEKSEKTTIKIMDAQGKQLTVTSTIIPAGNSKQLLSMSRFAAGVYYLVVENSNVKRTMMVVKE